MNFPQNIYKGRMLDGKSWAIGQLVMEINKDTGQLTEPYIYIGATSSLAVKIIKIIKGTECVFTGAYVQAKHIPENRIFDGDRLERAAFGTDPVEILEVYYYPEHATFYVRSDMLSGDGLFPHIEDCKIVGNINDEVTK